jgi:hypothetical protein
MPDNEANVLIVLGQVRKCTGEVSFSVEAGLPEKWLDNLSKVTKAARKKAKKKRTYKRRDMQAESTVESVPEISDEPEPEIIDEPDPETTE